VRVAILESERSRNGGEGGGGEGEGGGKSDSFLKGFCGLLQSNLEVVCIE